MSDVIGMYMCGQCGRPVKAGGVHNCTFHEGVLISNEATRRRVDEEYNIVKEQMRDERIAILDEVRQLVAEEAAKLMSLTCDSKEQGNISRLYAAIVTAIDAMKAENDGK